MSPLFWVGVAVYMCGVSLALSWSRPIYPIGYLAAAVSIVLTGSLLMLLGLWVP